MLKDDPMWSAPREHMPRSPLWKKMDRWDHILEEITKLGDDVRKQLKQDTPTATTLHQIPTSRLLQINGRQLYLAATARSLVYSSHGCPLLSLRLFSNLSP